MIPLDYGLPTDKEGIQLRLGVARGFFRDEGIDLNLKVIYGGPEVAKAYDSGEIIVGKLGSPPAITAMGAGARFKIIASAVRRNALMYLVVAPEIRDWDDLRGKTVAALTKGSCSYWFMRLILENHALKLDQDVRYVDLGARYGRMVELFKGGEIQAAVVTEPNVAIGESRGAFRVMQALTDPEYCPSMQWVVVVANDAAREKQAGLLQAVLRASRRSYHYCAENVDEWAAFAADHYNTEKATMQRAIDREIGGLHYDCQPDLPGLQQAIELQRRLGAISGPMDAASIVDLRMLPKLESQAARN